MDISQLSGNSLQSVLSALGQSGPAQSSVVSSDPFSTALQSLQSSEAASSTTSGGSSSGLAMLQALQNMFGTSDASDPVLQLLSSSDGADGTSMDDPLLDPSSNTTDDLGSMFNGEFAVLQALQGTNCPQAGGSSASSSNDLAMLQALNTNNPTSFLATMDNNALQAFFGTPDSSASNSSLAPQAFENSANSGPTNIG